MCRIRAFRIFSNLRIARSTPLTLAACCTRHRAKITGRIRALQPKTLNPEAKLKVS